jgi:hypothetical protein
MKKISLFALALALGIFAAAPAFAQNQYPYGNNGHNSANNPQADTRGEHNLADRVDIVGQPRVDVSTNSARVMWQTNNNAATDVWLEGGNINGHRAAYVPGGTREHTATFDNLRRNTTYTYLIRARDGVRYQGSFTTR